MKYNIQVYEGEVNGHGEKEGLPTVYQYEFEQELLKHVHDLKQDQRERMVSTRPPRGFPELISEDFESKLRFKTQTTIIPFFPVNQKHPQRQCPVKKCIQVC